MFVLPTALRGVSVLFAVLLVVSSAHAASDASDQTPPENVRGETYNGGPKNVFEKGEKKSGDDKKVEEKKSDKKHEDKEHKKEKEKKADKNAAVDSKSTPAEAGKPASSSPWGDSALSLLNFPEDKPKETPVLSAYQTDLKYRGAIARLCTSGWREAEAELIQGSKASVPYLIEGMSSTENAYANGGHTKADSSRALRQRPLSEVCCEILRTIVMTRSNYTGELPGSDAQAWQTWFSTHGSTVTFAN